MSHTSCNVSPIVIAVSLHQSAFEYIGLEGCGMQVLGCAAHSANMALPSFNDQKECVAAAPNCSCSQEDGGIGGGLLEGCPGMGAAVALGALGWAGQPCLCLRSAECCSALVLLFVLTNTVLRERTCAEALAGLTVTSQLMYSLYASIVPFSLF